MPRKSISFRLQFEIIEKLEQLWLQFKLDGIHIKQADLREDIILLGLERAEELRDRYLGHMPKLTEGRGSDDAADRFRGGLMADE